MLTGRTTLILAGLAASGCLEGSLVTPLGGAAWPTLLAQIQTPPIEGVGQWLWMFIGVIAIAVLVLKGINEFRKAFGRRPGLDDVLKTLASLAHVSELRTEFDGRSETIECQLVALQGESADRERRLNDKLEAHWKELNKERSENTKDLHQRIEALHETSRLEADEKFKEMRSAITAMPREIIAILKDTGAIKGGSRS